MYLLFAVDDWSLTEEEAGEAVLGERIQTKEQLNHAIFTGIGQSWRDNFCQLKSPRQIDPLAGLFQIRSVGPSLTFTVSRF